MPNLVPQDINEWMRRAESRLTELTRRANNLVPGDIGDGVDLDGFMSSGRFRRKSNALTTTALNYPFNGAAGILEVYWLPDGGSVQVQQIFYDRSGSRHSRWFNGVSWSTWDGVWMDITTGFSAGVTAQTGSNTPQAMRQGNIVAVRGRVTVAAGTSGALNFGLVPDDMQPVGISELGHGSTSGSQTSRYFVPTSGQLQVQAWPNSASNAVGALSAVYGVGQ
jgi:hypothetical protein